MQIFLMIYSIFPIALYGAIVFLNIFLIVFALANLGLALGLFVFLRKVGIFEREKMLPLAFLKLHAKEYTEEYNKKLKEVIGGSHLPAEIEPRVNN